MMLKYLYLRIAQPLKKVHVLCQSMQKFITDTQYFETNKFPQLHHLSHQDKYSFAYLFLSFCQVVIF